MNARLILAFVIALLCSSTKADYRVSIDGDSLYALCNGINPQTMQPSPTWAEANCLGYINGVIDVWGKLRTFGAIKEGGFALDFCLPVSGIKGGEVIGLVRSYLETKTQAERRADGGARFVTEALVQSYPCR